jgi:hypothetical protein
MIMYAKMEKLRRLFRLFLIFVFLGINLVGAGIGRASDGTGENTVRQTSIVITYTRYEWWLLRWSDNQILCHVYVDHDGLPTASDILIDCGGNIYSQWITTQPCSGLDQGNVAPSVCLGLYLYFIGSAPAEKEVKIDLPPAEVYLSLKGCSPTLPENLCPTIPSLHFEGVEPLPNDQITAIHVKLDGVETVCQGSTCDVGLHATRRAGTSVEFWADSSFGDSSEIFTALVRVIESGVSLNPSSGGWYVDVLSNQWRGNPLATCAEIWQALPPVGGVPEWLSTPEDAAFLASEQPYSYLAGRLIAAGVVNASSCPSGGLLTNGYADNCGLGIAMPEVITWQNQFDGQIMQIAAESGVPAQLLKNLFAQESQFWPGMYREPQEFGLGQITDNGADALLLWNPSFFNQFCPLVLNEEQCSQGYLKLDGNTQAILRGALASSSNVDCVTCEYGIDLTSIDESINLVAQSMLANCDQVAQITYNATGQVAGKVASYDDLWKFTIADYHIGPGCLSYAMYTTWAARSPMDWEHVSNHLTEPCQSVIPYVTQITSSPSSSP